MKRTFTMWSCCAAVIVASHSSADEPNTNEPPGRSSTTNAPAATSTNAAPPLAALRAEFSEISVKLQEWQKQATNAPEVRAVMTEFETARKDLQAAQQRVIELQKKLRETMIAAVTKQDPSAKQLIDRQQELIKQIQGPNHPSRAALPPHHPPITATNSPSSRPAEKPAENN